MKLLIVAVIALSSSYGFALDFSCEKQVSSSRVEYAHISGWPNISVSTSFEECTTNGDVSQCRGGSLENIADDYTVCFRDVEECSVEETETSLEISCYNGSRLRFTVNQNSVGQITCSEQGVVRKTWNVGACIGN